MKNKKALKSSSSTKYRYYFIAVLFLLTGLVILQILDNRIWDGKSRFTILMQNISESTKADQKNLIIFSIEPAKSRAIFLLIPANTMLDLPYGYDTYPAFSIYQLGELDQNRGGGLLLSKSIETTFGVVVDGYLLSNNEHYLNLPLSSDEIDEFKQNLFSFFPGFNYLKSIIFSSHNFKSNLSMIDKLRLWNSIRKIRSDQIEFLSLSSSSIALQDKLPDGSAVYLIDSEVFDGRIDDHFQDSIIRNLQISIEVKNATSQQRIATWFARIIEHLGGDVILKTTANHPLDESCQISYYDKSLENSAIIKKLKQHYDCTSSISDQSDTQTDITVTIGEGFIR